jgi:hypothetical protein
VQACRARHGRPGVQAPDSGGVLAAAGARWASMCSARAAAGPGSRCGLEEVKRWAGDEVEGGRADLGSWAVDKSRWAAVWTAGLRPVKRQRTGGKGKGASADFRNLGRNHLWAEKGKEKGNSFLFSESIFVDNKII